MMLTPTLKADWPIYRCLGLIPDWLTDKWQACGIFCWETDKYLSNAKRTVHVIYVKLGKSGGPECSSELNILK